MSEVAAGAGGREVRCGVWLNARVVASAALRLALSGVFV